MQTTMSKQRAAAAKSASGKIEREWGKTQRCSSASAAEKGKSARSLVKGSALRKLWEIETRKLMTLILIKFQFWALSQSQSRKFPLGRPYKILVIPICINIYADGS